MMFIIEGILFVNSCNCFSFIGDNTTWKTVAWKPIRLGDFFECQKLSESIQNHPKLSGTKFWNRVSIRDNSYQLEYIMIGHEIIYDCYTIFYLFLYQRYDNEVEWIFLKCSCVSRFILYRLLYMYLTKWDRSLLWRCNGTSIC